MLNKDEIIIRRPRIEEIETINSFFVMVLNDTFEMNGIGDLKELLEEEIRDKRKSLNQDFESNGLDRYFLLAEYQGEIIGSIEFGLSNDLIKQCTNDEYKDLFEIGTVFIHPSYQRHGIVSILLFHLLQEIQKREAKEFCLDSGYKIAQGIWRKKFGEPEYFLKDFWGEGAPHMIWRVRVNETLEKLTITVICCK